MVCDAWETGKQITKIKGEEMYSKVKYRKRMLE